MVSWGGGWDIGLLLWVDSGSLVCDIGDISIITIAGVLDMLDTSIGKSNRVGSGDVGGTIRLLLSVEVGLGVVISNSVGEGVGGDLIGVLLGLVSWSRGVVSWSSLHNNWSNNWGSLHNNWSSVGNNWSVDSVGNNGGSVDGVGNWVSHNWGVDSVVGSVDHWSMDSVGSVDSNWGSMDSMSNSVVGSEVSSMGDHTSVADGGVVSNVRGGEGGSEAEQGRDDESLKNISLQNLNLFEEVGVDSI